MGDEWRELIKQAPALALLVWMVYVFLNHLRQVAEDSAGVCKSHDEAIRQVAGCLGTALDRNTSALTDLRVEMEKNRSHAHDRPHSGRNV